MAKTMNWLLSGNSGTSFSTDSLGTTDNQPLIIKTNGEKRMLIDTAGNIGIGASDPQAKLEVRGTNANIRLDNPGQSRLIISALAGSETVFQYNSGAGTPGLTFMNGFGVPIVKFTGDLKVGIGTTSPNDQLEIAATEGGRAIVSDGAGATRRVILFQAPTASRDYGRIVAHQYGIGGKNLILQDTGGNVGIGTTSPSHKLHVTGQEGVRVRINSKINSGVSLALNEQSQWSVATVLVGDPEFPRGDFQIYNDRVNRNAVYIDGLSLRVGIGTTTPGFALDVAGEAHASDFLVSSDERLKTDVAKLTNVLEKLEKIRGVSFEWNEAYESQGRSTGHREIGVIAQEVETVFPELVTSSGDEGFRTVSYSRLTAILVEAIKELRAEKNAQTKALAAEHIAQQRQIEIQQRIIEALRTENAVQQEQNKAIGARLATLERAVGSPSAEVKPASQRVAPECADVSQSGSEAARPRLKSALNSCKPQLRGSRQRRPALHHPTEPLRNKLLT